MHCSSAHMRLFVLKIAELHTLQFPYMHTGFRYTVRHNINTLLDNKWS